MSGLAGLAFLNVGWVAMCLSVGVDLVHAVAFYLNLAMQMEMRDEKCILLIAKSNCIRPQDQSFLMRFLLKYFTAAATEPIQMSEAYCFEDKITGNSQ